MDRLAKAAMEGTNKFVQFMNNDTMDAVYRLAVLIAVVVILILMIPSLISMMKGESYVVKVKDEPYIVDVDDQYVVKKKDDYVVKVDEDYTVQAEPAWTLTDAKLSASLAGA